ncbi:MAG: hypothetical protein Q8M16_14690 [Pirellulaceae bacterium]|nr:hypothetical protein [Pirellulaceae bacterium]
MRRILEFALCLLVLSTSWGTSWSCPATVFSQTAEIAGQWITDRGAVTITISNESVSGTFAGGGTLRGTKKGDVYEVQCERPNQNQTWTGTIELDAQGSSFKGQTTENGATGTWKGWKRDATATTGETIDASGYWLTNWGAMHLEQTGNSVKGFFSSARWGSVEGTVEGRKLSLNWRRFSFSGKAELEVSSDGSRIFGLDTGENGTAWFGIRPTGFAKHAEPKAGEIVKGIANNGMLYFLRMPDGWKAGDSVDVVVLLHGSNWTTAGMVFVTNTNSPEIGKKFAILGLQGEQWAKRSDVDDLRFNYTYVNWVGRSTYGGFPGTDRESPYLVAEVLDELEEQYQLKRIFLGGHSQGGFLSYVMHMNFPEKLAGTFPIAGGLIFQAEPDAFDNEALKAEQRETPMAIIHGKNDNVVEFSMGEYAYNNFVQRGFGKVKLIAPNLGHPYDFLPVAEAIEYLDALSTEDKLLLLEFAKKQVTKKNWRDVGNAVSRAKEIDGGPEFGEIWQKLQEAAKKDAAKLLKEIERNANNKWVDKYYEYEFHFRNADAAQPIMEAFEALRERHREPADDLMKQAREAFQNNNRANGYQLYERIVNEYYASVHFTTVRSALKNRR